MAKKVVDVNIQYSNSSREQTRINKSLSPIGGKTEFHSKFMAGIFWRRFGNIFNQYVQISIVLIYALNISLKGNYLRQILTPLVHSFILELEAFHDFYAKY